MLGKGIFPPYVPARALLLPRGACLNVPLSSITVANGYFFSLEGPSAVDVAGDDAVEDDSGASSSSSSPSRALCFRNISRRPLGRTRR